MLYTHMKFKNIDMMSHDDLGSPLRDHRKSVSTLAYIPPPYQKPTSDSPRPHKS